MNFSSEAGFDKNWLNLKSFFFVFHSAVVLCVDFDSLAQCICQHLLNYRIFQFSLRLFCYFFVVGRKRKNPIWISNRATLIAQSSTENQREWKMRKKWFQVHATRISVKLFKLHLVVLHSALYSNQFEWRIKRTFLFFFALYSISFQFIGSDWFFESFSSCCVKCEWMKNVWVCRVLCIVWQPLFFHSQ